MAGTLPRRAESGFCPGRRPSRAVPKLVRRYNRRQSVRVCLPKGRAPVVRSFDVPLRALALSIDQLDPDFPPSAGYFKTQIKKLLLQAARTLFYRRGDYPRAAGVCNLSLRPSVIVMLAWKVRSGGVQSVWEDGRRFRDWAGDAAEPLNQSAALPNPNSVDHSISALTSSVSGYRPRGRCTIRYCLPAGIRAGLYGLARGSRLSRV